MALSDKEFHTLVSLAKQILWTDPETRRRLQAAGLHITPANFYSSIPLVADIESSFEYVEESIGQAPYATNAMYDARQMREFLAAISAYADEFDPPLEGDLASPTEYFWKNPAFSRTDAMAYYCVLRAMRPARVVEIGSGFSTLVADAALRRNGSGELVLIEPYPKPFLRTLPTVSGLIEKPVQAIPERELVALVDSCQVWFIDSTHTVKTGSDCLYLYLKVMPQVTSPVLCHSHDVFLPYGMPTFMALEKNVYWTEQYLLQAYLLDNPKANVVFGSYWALLQAPDESAAFMRGRHEAGGGSFWYMLNGPRPFDAGALAKG